MVDVSVVNAINQIVPVLFPWLVAALMFPFIILLGFGNCGYYGGGITQIAVIH